MENSCDFSSSMENNCEIQSSQSSFPSSPVSSLSSLSNSPKPGCSFSSLSVECRKRHCVEGDDTDDDQPSSKILVEEKTFGLELLCDEILLEIFQNLDGNSLSAIGRTCVRFYLLVNDHRLWKNVDLISEPLPAKILKERLKSINSHTENLRIRGMTESYPLPKWKTVTLCDNLLKKITESCENLQVLELYHSFLDLERISIANFPKNIKKLVLNNCYARIPPSRNTFFTKIDTHLVQLEELIIEYCNWFETHDLVLFSKIPMLKKLSLRGCNNLKECVPYGSIAARFGFKKLEHLDIRDTPISDSDIQCFVFSQTLKELFLECPMDLRDQSNDVRPSRPTFIEAQDPDDYIFANDLNDYENYSNFSGPIIHCNCSSGSCSSTNRNNRNVIQPLRGNTPNEWVIIPPRNINSQDNLIHIVVNDYSYINIQSTNRNNNQENPAIQVDVDLRGQPNVRPIHDISRAMSRSLWFERRFPPSFSPPRMYPISDRGICGFGLPRNPVQAGMVWIRAENRPADHRLEKLVVRFYKQVTNTSLYHLAQCSPNLSYLDLTGTSVTKSGVERFRRLNPTCDVVVDHLSDLFNDSSNDNDSYSDRDDDEVSR